MKRRDFLKYLGAGVVGTGAGLVFGQITRTPGAKLIPYVIPPEDTVPGVANWYASLCTECSAGCGVTVKVMEGRVKKIEGNPLHPVSQGGLCVRGQASVQALYNPDRITSPMKKDGDGFKAISWDEALSTLAQNLKGLETSGAKGLYVLTPPLRGHLNTLIKDFITAYGSSNHIKYELFDHRNLRHAGSVATNSNALPHYDIANSKYVLSFGADFATTFLSPVGMSKGYGNLRQGKGARGKVVQVEPRMSLTGANADEWVPAKPGTEAVLALSIAHEALKVGHYTGADSGTWKSLLRGFSAKEAVARYYGR